MTIGLSKEQLYSTFNTLFQELEKETSSALQAAEHDESPQFAKELTALMINIPDDMPPSCAGALHATGNAIRAILDTINKNNLAIESKLSSH